MAPKRAHDFHLLSHWSVEASIAEVADVLEDAHRLPLWWPQVYLDVQILHPGDGAGLGRTIAIHSRGWLPYTLRWQALVIDVERLHGWTIEATGDLVGLGVWRLTQNGTTAEIDYDWRVAAEKPLLRRLSPLLKPAFAANHRWAMARGLEGLRRELVRRRTS